MAALSELYEFLQGKFPESLSCEWDNDGIMVSSDTSSRVKKILFALDVSLGALEYANTSGCDTIISHHPLIFRPIGELYGENITAKRAIYAIKNDINVLSFHTRLDAARGGVNDVLCDLLEITDTRPYGPMGEEIGRLGVLWQPHSLLEWCDVIKNRLNTKAVLVTDAGRTVQHAAVIGGDGKDFLIPALKSGADTFLCGRCSYNMSVDARDLGINIIEAGHYHTEAPVLFRLRDLICEQYPEIETEFYCSNATNLV